MKKKEKSKGEVISLRRHSFLVVTWIPRKEHFPSHVKATPIHTWNKNQNSSTQEEVSDAAVLLQLVACSWSLPTQKTIFWRVNAYTSLRGALAQEQGLLKIPVSCLYLKMTQICSWARGEKASIHKV